MTEINNETERLCGWVYERLRDFKRVTKDEFLAHYAKEKAEDSKALKNLEPSWNRAIHAVYAVLSRQGFDVSRDAAGLVLVEKGTPKDQGSRLDRYETAWFQTSRESQAKQRIGELIASFLSDDLLKGKTIFLGSGSTVYHVGLKMCEGDRRYDQRFVTVNIPLAALWCESKHRPVSQVSIPAAVLETQTSRFSTMPGPGWPLTVSIVGADGCFYDEDKEEVILYGNEESVATNTSLFVQNTRHSVLFCLTSTKIKMGFAQNPNTGPPIAPPKKGVIRVLVTNERYQNSVKAFEKDGWMIVTESDDWKPVLKKMKDGENTEVRSE